MWNWISKYVIHTALLSLGSESGVGVLLCPYGQTWLTNALLTDSMVPFSIVEARLSLTSVLVQTAHCHYDLPHTHTHTHTHTHAHPIMLTFHIP